ncbi:MAG: aminoacyl--tRNA ligase-related protein [Patescibacteria group bacterium]|jgi:prolyl-tRNA synthetase
MLYSKLLGKTRKELPRDEVSLNAQLLIRGGFIQKEMAGVYAFMPLGKRVLDKVTQVIREEMEAIGGQEIHLGALQNPEVWKKTGRWDDSVIDVWFKTMLNSGSELGLGTTHEEPLANIMRSYISSYKDLPLYAFQFQTKFRNEARAKSGLLRTREFIMKDLYSFNATQEDLDVFYEGAKEAYYKIFKRLGLGDRTYLTFASGGAFSKYSHEFQTVCDSGEDTIYLSREKGIAVNKEVYNDEVLAELGLAKADMEEVSAIEVGNIFKLGTKYSEPLELFYADPEGKRKPVIMGSYGIAPSRSMGTIVETSHDEKGIIWPKAVAPYQVHLIGVNMENEGVRKEAFELYEKFLSNDVEILFDDRAEVRAGEKFSDADIIGIPYRVIVSERSMDPYEVKERSSDETKMLAFGDILGMIIG